ncbi:MAG TPA: hypothetical protein V6C81_15710 [Planktothrix sp.]|jgi:hypothetical protein
MKLSAILVSASLPIAVSTAASAADDAQKGSTLDFLKHNLASVDPSVNQKETTIRVGSRSFSRPTAQPAAAPGLKLRPFVAHRKLPSQRELDMQLISQTAKMAAQPSSPPLTAQTATLAVAPKPLSGNVSEVYQTVPDQTQYGANSNVATYGAVGYVKQSSSRVVPGQVPSVQGQIRQFKSGKRTRYLPKPQQEAPQPESQQPPQMAMQQTGQQMQMQDQMNLQTQANMQAIQPRRYQPSYVPPSQMPSQMQFNPPPLSPDEQAILDRMVNDVNNESSNADVSGMPIPTAGAAPFPLSLLPQDSLHHLISHHSTRQDGQATSSFGSWHQDRIAGLPQGGFQNYSSGAMRSSQHANTQYVHARHYQQQHQYATHPTSRPPQSQNETRSMAQLRRLPPQDLRATNYAPYSRYGGSGSIAY